MTIMIISLIIGLFLVLATLGGAMILCSRSIIDREKIAPFECGFDPKNLSRIPFSLRFFLLALIFLVFDIEIALLLPIPMIKTLIPNMGPSMTAAGFLFILTVGLLHEWHEGSLNWSN